MDGENNNMTTSSGSSGSLIGSIIVVIILIVGAIYLFSQKASAPEAPVAPVENTGPVVIPTTSVTQESLDAEANAAADDTANLSSDLDTLNTSL